MNIFKSLELYALKCYAMGNYIYVSFQLDQQPELEQEGS